MPLPGTSGGRIDILSQVRDLVTQMHLVLTGDFDAAIAEYTKIRDDAEAKLTFVTTAAEVTQAKADADAYAKSTKAAADLLLKQAHEENDRVVAAGTAAINARTALSAAQKQLEKDRASFKEESDLLSAGIAADRAAIVNDRRQLADDAFALEKAQEQLKKDQATLANRLEALKSL